MTKTNANVRVGVVGLGYVGLPLALQFASAGVEVLGFDVDQEKIKRLNRGESYIRHIKSSTISAQRDRGFFAATKDFARIKSVEAVIICVPTPLNRQREPDISFILDTARVVAPPPGRARWSCWSQPPIPAQLMANSARCSKLGPD